MGAALLKKPDVVKEVKNYLILNLIFIKDAQNKIQILTTLVNGCKKPITCKIRCLHTIEETIDLCKLIESCGVRAIGIHGRFKEERSKSPNHDVDR